MSATEFFAGFWWLIFPIMGFAFGGFSMFMRHRQSQKALDILKAYADQGKDPPPEVLRAVYGYDPQAQGYGGPNGAAPGSAPSGNSPGNTPPPGYGAGPGWGGPVWGESWNGPGNGPWTGPWTGPWGWRGGPWSWRAYRWGPFWAWRRVFIFTSLSIGFSVAAWYEGGQDAHGLVIVAIIMGVLALGALLTAIMQSMWKPR